MTRHARLDLDTIARLGDLTPREMRIYCFLLACRNGKTGRCDPGRASISAGVRLPASHVSTGLAGLVKKQWIGPSNEGGFLILEVTKTVTKKVTELVINPTPKVTKTVTKSYQNGNKTRAKKVTNLDRKVTNLDRKVTNLVTSTPYISLNNKNNKEQNNVAEAGDASVSEKANKIFEYWKKTFGKSSRFTFTKERRNVVIARLKKYSVRDIFDAIDGCKKSPIHAGDNDRQTIYDDLELICRNDTKLEKFIECNERGRVRPRNADVGRSDPAAIWVPPPPCEFCGDVTCNKIECGEKRRAAA